MTRFGHFPRFLGAALLCLAPLPGLAAEAGSGVPLDLAYSRRQLTHQDRAEVSHDGRWLAYDRETPPRCRWRPVPRRNRRRSARTG